MRATGGGDRAGSARAHALGYLTHPLVVVSLVLLVINDAAWKGAGPGWLTGKLSDFAGLVFFPGLLALLMGIGTPRVPARTAGLVSWWSTAVVFVAVKTVPAANAALVALIGAVRSPGQVVLDPTDVAAVAVLPLGWWLWTRTSPVTARSTFKAAAGWGVATYAVMATAATSCSNEAHIDRVIAFEGALYVDDTYFGSAISTDHGLTWRAASDETPEPPAMQPSHPELYTAGPRELCHAQRVDICFRITSETTIEESSDGGRTWRTAWTEPAYDIERRKVAHCGEAEGAQSLVFAESADPILVVAMGTEGLLRHELAGSWKRIYPGRTGLLDNPAPEPPRRAFWGLGSLFGPALLVAGSAFVALVLIGLAVTRRRPAGPRGYMPGYIDHGNPYAPAPPPPPPSPFAGR